MVVDHHGRGDQAAVSAITGERQPAERIRLDLARLAAQLAPGDRAVLIGVEPDYDVEVADRDVPLTANRAVGADLDAQIAVGSEMRLGGAGRGDQREQQRQAQAH